ncbi:MAG: lipid-A-disaccharide synthase [Chamaesiphon sp. CSU_1_12]|nr:lipid-A-disaccharide synthase [Chamaesiphon sp. CSU_1_12]
MTNTPKTIFITTGDVSGDLQGALLIAALRQQAEKVGIDLNIVALGGSKMAAAGAKVLADTASISSMGIVEHAAFIKPAIQAGKIAREYLKTTPPDAIVLIDYVDPNIAIGKYARSIGLNIPILYYIAPQDWVWPRQHKRARLIASFVDEIFSVFPIEAEYFTQQGAKAKFVGHPLVDRIATIPSREVAREQLGITPDEIAVALIPASRQQELKYLLPAIFEAAQQIQAKLPNVRFWIPLSRPDFQAEIESQIKAYQINANLVTTNPDLVLSATDLAITKCGTVTLELALLNVPQVVIYRVSRITAWIAKNVLKFAIPYMSPPNLVEMKSIVPELLQDEANPDRIAAESLELILNKESRDRMLADYNQMRAALGDTGVCDRVAVEILAKL